MKSLIAVFLWAVFCIPLFGSDITWSSPTTLSSVTTVNSSDPQVVIDSSDNATAVWVENGFILASRQPSGGSWSAATTISSDNSASPRLAVDPSGNVTAVWIQDGQVVTSTYTGGMWSASPQVLSFFGASSLSFSSDGVGNMAAAWMRNGNIETATRLFGQEWPSVPQVIVAPGAVAPQIALGGSVSGRSVVVWHAPSSMMINTVYAATATTGEVWGSPTAISDTSKYASCPQVAVDQHGNAIAMWYSYDVDVTGTFFSNVIVTSAIQSFGGSWETPKAVSNIGVRNPRDLRIKVGFDPDGNAVALWSTSYDDVTFTLESSVLVVGGSWLEPNATSTSNYSYAFDLCSDNFGNAYATYMESFDAMNFSIISAGQYVDAQFKETWSVPDTISSGMVNGFPVIGLAYLPTLTSPIGVPANSVVAAWVSYNGTNNVIQAARGIGPIVLPPTALTVTQSANNHEVFTEYTNTITWVDSTSPNVDSYLIFRNGKYIASVSPSVMTYTDNNRHQAEPTTYGVATLDSQGMQSRIVTISYPSN